MLTRQRLAQTLISLVLAVHGRESGAAGQPSSSPADPCCPLPAEAWDYAQARHLLCRAGFGGSPEEVERLRAMGIEQAVRHLVAYHGLSDVEFSPPPALPPPPRPAELSRLDPQARQQQIKRRRQAERAHLDAARAWWVRRMMETPRPLEEKMVLFWHGHFATGARTVRDSQAMLEQNQLFRCHAVGNFGQLLHAIVHDPAMLRYLDNNRNAKGQPNENLARELLELFSLGEGNYSEQDIQEAARALTGYHVDRFAGRFRFAARAHDAGSKTVFGRTGEFDGDQLVDLILAQPATARWIARKLFVFFVHDGPADVQIERLAEVLRGHDYELAPLLETLFRSGEFYSPQALGTQIKSPVQLTVGSLRALGIRDADAAAVGAALRAMGQELFEPPNVKGWDGGRTWINGNWLLARQRFAVGLFAPTTGEVPTAALARQQPKGAGPPPPLAARLDLTAECQQRQLFAAEAVVDHFAAALCAAPLKPEERAELIEYLGSLPPAAEWEAHRDQIQARLGSLLRLIMTMPGYQLT